MIVKLKQIKTCCEHIGGAVFEPYQVFYGRHVFVWYLRPLVRCSLAATAVFDGGVPGSLGILVGSVGTPFRQWVVFCWWHPFSMRTWHCQITYHPVFFSSWCSKPDAFLHWLPPWKFFTGRIWSKRPCFARESGQLRLGGAQKISKDMDLFGFWKTYLGTLGP